MSVFLLLIGQLGLSASAHELRPAIAELEVIDDALQIRLLVNLESLIAEIGPEHDDTDASPNARTYERLRQASPDVLETRWQAFSPTVLDGIRISDGDGLALPAPIEVDSIRIPDVGDTRVARDTVLTLQLALAETPSAIRWRWNREFGPLILRVGESGDEDAFSQYLQAGEPSDSIELVDRQPQSAGAVFVDYVGIGFEHIIPKGLDHILFVLGLFLLSPYWKPILWQVTAFTVAHSITLALSTFGLISVPASIVEPLIALSITAVCLENVFRRDFGSTRLAIIVGFGLLHGLGFASVLGEFGLSREQFLISLLGFNIGVELGQLAIILLCFVLIGWWFRQHPGYRRWFSIPASTIIGAVGLYWFITRLTA